MTLAWSVTTFLGPTCDPEGDGTLNDEGHGVGRAWRAARGTDERLQRWFWSMFAFAAVRPAVVRSGIAGTKDEAKAAVERAYAVFVEMPGARARWLKHNDGVKWRQVPQLRL